MPRLLDIPAIRALEDKALLDPARRVATYPLWSDEEKDVADATEAAFGIRASGPYLAPPDQWEATEIDMEAWEDAWDAVPEAYDLFLDEDEKVAAAAFKDVGWDVTTELGQPAYCLPHVAFALIAAIRGEYGARLPEILDRSAETWGEGLAAEAKRFRGGGKRGG